MKAKFATSITYKPCSDQMVSLHNSVDTKAKNSDNLKLYTAGLSNPLMYDRINIHHLVPTLKEPSYHEVSFFILLRFSG